MFQNDSKSDATKSYNLAVGQLDDKYEREADRVADSVMRMPDSQVQMQSMGEEEEELQMMPESPSIQRMCPRCRERARQGKPLNCPECEKELQMKPDIRLKENGKSAAGPGITSQMQSSKGSGSPLPSKIQTELGSKMGADFSEVNVHTDSKAVQMNRQVGARAFTVGSDIYFNRGEYNPNSSSGKHLLAHELTHVVQQNYTPASQRVQRTINDGHDLTNPRFAGVPMLEACFDGERFLFIGHQGVAVEKVQQALVDAGFPLPKFGIDGLFGNETHSALRQFQGAAGILADGIVGPETMARFDTLPKCTATTTATDTHAFASPPLTSVAHPTAVPCFAPGSGGNLLCTSQGEVFGVNDPTSGLSDELMLWDFCHNDDDLRPNHRSRLTQESTRWAQMLNSSGNMRLKIVGSASSSEHFMAAVNRATAVKTFLENHHIPSRAIDMGPHLSSQSSLADEITASNEAHNRRVDVFLFVPTIEVGSLGPSVDAIVHSFSIGDHPNGNGPVSTFDIAENLFAMRLSGAMRAQAEVTLTAIVGGASIGFLQFLTRDMRVGIYKSNADGKTLLLDYSRCLEPFLPCRDVLDATSQFSFDARSLTLTQPGSVTDTVSIQDSPGTAFPLLYPNSQGPFELVKYVWQMEFDTVLGVRVGSSFLPLRHAFWALIAKQSVEPDLQQVSGFEPISVQGNPEPGMDSAINLEAAMAGRTCRLATRSMTGGACLPHEILILP